MSSDQEVLSMTITTWTQLSTESNNKTINAQSKLLTQVLENSTYPIPHFI